MSRTEADLRCFALTQMLDVQYWDWSDDEGKTIEIAQNTGNVLPMLQTITKRLHDAGMVTSEAHGIIHNKDVREVWDESACKVIKQKKAPHVHMVFRFVPNNGGTINEIADIVGLAPQYIEKAGRGKYGWDNLMSYLIHAKDKDKHQYKATDVVSDGDVNYQDYYADHKLDWDKGKAVKTCQKAKDNIDNLETKILTGEVTKPQVILTDKYYDIYARYKKRCDDAFATYGERRAYKTMQALQDGDFRLSVFYLMGEAGAGKTTFGLKLAQIMSDWSLKKYGERWRIAQTAATNALDDYEGEEILLMDDVRGGSMIASDWLKLLDPINASAISARYRNKKPACRCIIITSSKDPLEFFYYTRSIGGDRSEALDQFIRRIQSRVQVIRTDNMDTEYWIANTKRNANGVRSAANIPGVYTPVYLSYDFEQGKMYDYDGAIDYLISQVDKNNGLIEIERMRVDELDEACPDLSECIIPCGDEDTLELG